MSGLSGVPYILVLEREDAPQENLTSWPIVSQPVEIQVDIPPSNFEKTRSVGRESADEESSDSNTHGKAPTAKKTLV